MIEDYKEKVIDAYKKKRQASALSTNLLFPSPGKLKKECFIVYRERRLAKDEKILRAFFGTTGHATDYSQSIGSCDIDKFRPLLNYLNRKTNVTEIKNIDLLAWLIDFEPRPFNFEINYKEVLKTEGPSASLANTEEAEIITILPIASFPKQENPDRSVETSISIPLTNHNEYDDRSNAEIEVKEHEVPGSTLENDQIKKDEIKEGNTHILGGGIENIGEAIQPKPSTPTIGNNNIEEENANEIKANIPGEKIPGTEKSETKPKRFLYVTGKINGLKRKALESKFRKAILSFIIVVVTGSIGSLYWRTKAEQCMYWTGDHYQPISCYQKVGDTAVIALDTIKAAHLKKITHPDTLTQNSLGKVWYSKINNVVEFYTSAGFHPVEDNRRLRPVTLYIITKYAHSAGRMLKISP